MNADLLKWLCRAEGQIRGVIRPIEEGRDCTGVVTQLAACPEHSTAPDSRSPRAGCNGASPVTARRHGIRSNERSCSSQWPKQHRLPARVSHRHQQRRRADLAARWDTHLDWSMLGCSPFTAIAGSIAGGRVASRQRDQAHRRLRRAAGRSCLLYGGGLRRLAGLWQITSQEGGRHGRHPHTSLSSAPARRASASVASTGRE
jgi:hypothetical protein